MANANMDGLPPEMQARIQQIIEGAKQKAAAPQPEAPAPAPAPVQKVPNLMDHVIMLRQEVDAMRQQIAAMGQVTDAVGQAVGSLYQMFQSHTEPTTASSAFQTQQFVEEEADY